MNKKEVGEIRKQFKEDKSTISRICCCYVNHEKNKIMESSGMFLTMPEEELFKYFEIFRKTLSGTIGKNMLNMEFPLTQEAPGGTQYELLALLDSRLEDDQMVSDFFDKIIANYSYPENYLILLIYAAYDVPGKSGDNLDMFDASDSVYSHMLCSICPVNLTPAGLCYNGEHNQLETRIRDWVVEMPMNGFLFPAFNDRATDLHNVLYYTAKPDGDYGLQEGFLENVLGARIPLSAGNQKEVFQELVEEALGETCDYDTMVMINENLNEMIETSKESPEPLELSAPSVKQLLAVSGVPDENLEDFEDTYEHIAGAQSVLTASNVAETKKLSVETSGITIKANLESVDLMEMRLLDGRPCLVIPVDDRVTVNGISVKSMKGIRVLPEEDTDITEEN